jgi:hypothetical protein
MRWSLNEDIYILHRAHQGLKAVDIAKGMARTKIAVKFRLQWLRSPEGAQRLAEAAVIHVALRTGAVPFFEIAVKAGFDPEVWIKDECLGTGDFRPDPDVTKPEPWYSALT